MSGQNNTLGVTPRPVVMAFYTTGDTRIIRFNTTYSGQFQARAQSLASDPKYVFGATSLADAIAQLKAITPATQMFDKVYFVGHGYGNAPGNGGNSGGYFVSGHPDARSEFTGTEVLRDPTVMDRANSPARAQGCKDFMDELAKHLAAGKHIEIGFLSCFSGQPTLLTWVRTVMNAKGFTSLTVGGYINDYRIRAHYTSSGTPDPARFEDKVFIKNAAGQLVEVPGLTTGAPNEIPKYESTG